MRLMRMRQLLVYALVVMPGAWAVVPAAAQQPDEAATHEELRMLRDGMFAAWQQRDLDALLTYVDENVVVTWQNAEVNRGHDGIRSFYDEMLGGDDPILADMQSTLEMQEMSLLHGQDAAIAYGTLHDEVTFNVTPASAPFIGSDSTISLDSRWTAALARKDGRWQLTAFHVSTNMFSNPVLSMATSATRWIMGIFGMIFGLIIAFAVMRFVGIRKTRSAA